jgi:hypothetical protein
VLQGVALSLSPLLRELIARTAVGVSLYVVSWFVIHVWEVIAVFLSSDNPCKYKYCTEYQLLDPFVSLSRVLVLTCSHRDDVPVAKQWAQVRGLSCRILCLGMRLSFFFIFYFADPCTRVLDATPVKG